MLLDKGVLQLNLSPAVSADYREIQKARPEQILASMYDLAELSTEETRLLSIFSVLPAKNIPLAHLADLLPTFAALEAAADGIARKGWVEFVRESGQFKISPVVQEIVSKENAARLGEDAKEMVESLVKKLIYEAGTGILIEIHDHQLALDYVQYGESLCQHLLCQRYDEDAAVLLDVLLERLGRFFTTFGDLPKALTFFEKDARLSQELHESHPEHISFKNGLAVSYYKLGEFFSKHQNDRASARQHFVAAQHIWEELVALAPDYAEFQRFLQQVRKDLAELDALASQA